MGNKSTKPAPFSCSYCGGREKALNGAASVCVRCGSLADPLPPVAAPVAANVPNNNNNSGASSSLASPSLLGDADADADAAGGAGSGANGYARLAANDNTGAPASQSQQPQQQQGQQQQQQQQQIVPQQQAVLRVTLHPFVESVTDEFSRMSPQDVATQVLAPYFRGRRVPIARDERFQIGHIDFKVGSCHPFYGVTTDTTVFSLGAPVSSLETIRKLHLLPVRATLPNPNSPPAADVLFRDYVRPLLTGAGSGGAPHISQGDVLVSRGVQFKAVACQPANGYVDADTEIFTDGAPLEDITKIHLLPVYETLPNSEKQITPDQVFFRYLEPYFVGRMALVTVGDEVPIDGVTFKVVAAEPRSGLVTLRTTMFAQGEPLRWEAIRRAQMDEDERLARQLQEEEDAQSRAALRSSAWQPRGAGAPGGLRFRSSGEMTREDYQERLRIVLERLPRDDPTYHLVRRHYNAVAQAGNSGSANGRNGELGMSMHDLLSAMVAAHRAAAAGGGGAARPGAPVGANAQTMRALPVRAYKKKHKTPPTAAAAAASASPTAAAAATGDTAAAAAAATAADGTAPATAAAAAPLSPAAAAAAAEAEEEDMCGICLCEYEEGDEVKTLPCFHVYHGDCIDRWLKGNRLCPTCKMSVE